MCRPSHHRRRISCIYLLARLIRQYQVWSIGMKKVVINLEEEDVIELQEIVMDMDFKGAYEFLKRRVLSQVEKKDKRKMDVDGKTHL